MSLRSEIGQEVSLCWVLCQQRERLLLGHAAHHAHQVGVLELCHLLGLQDVLEEDLTVFVCGILCKEEMKREREREREERSPVNLSSRIQSSYIEAESSDV